VPLFFLYVVTGPRPCASVPQTWCQRASAQQGRPRASGASVDLFFTLPPQT